jgi:hypothetical protein
MSTTGSATKPAKWVESFKLRLTPELYERAWEQARREESSVSQITRHALRRFLERRKMRTPAWAKGEAPPFLEVAGKKMRHDVRRERLRVRGLVRVHSDRERARTKLSEEERARRASRPKNRRWHELATLDDKIDALTQKQAEATERRMEAEARLAAGTRRRRTVTG